MKVALVTTWATACGIAEHSALLKAAVEAADPEITIEVITDLHPKAVLSLERDGVDRNWDLIWLNYHAALHSQWTSPAIFDAQVLRKVKVGVTYHDTGVPNSDQAKGICAAADAFVVHEPYADLSGNGRYWRMGVPAWTGAWQYDDSVRGWSDGRPILGTVGFPFPWKNYDELARVTGEVGWALLLIAPTSSPADWERWHGLNPHLDVIGTFPSRQEAIARLAGCDATAFCYTCANTGQSGAVLLGIAARKPVIAFGPTICRQFRALYEDKLGQETIWWTTGFDQVATYLRMVPIQRVSPAIVALAEQESWAKLGAKYAALFRELVDR